jgi:pimeloyl-ACP methyl ester carboxylesterase
MTTTSVLPDVGIELREGNADVGDVSLHYVEAGDGPLVVLLHGFPEFWFGWRLQIAPLAAAGFRVVAPDTRGYNHSSKPDGFESYAVDLLAADIRALIGQLGAESAMLVGHDWGGTIAWTTAMNHPEVVDRLAILNAAHPRRLSQGLHNPNQLRKSWYFFFFAVPGLPEEVVHLRDWHFFRHFLEDANPQYTPEEIERYVEAWSRRGAALCPARAPPPANQPAAPAGAVVGGDRRACRPAFPHRHGRPLYPCPRRLQGDRPREPARSGAHGAHLRAPLEAIRPSVCRDVLGQYRPPRKAPLTRGFRLQGPKLPRAVAGSWQAMLWRRHVVNLLCLAPLANDDLAAVDDDELLPFVEVAGDAALRDNR